MRKLVLLLLFCVPAFAVEHPGIDEFVKRANSEYGLPENEVRALLQQAEYKQSIIDAISRPAESKPWHEYRQIFLTEQRISEGVAFWKTHRELIRTASEQFGVDEEIIVSIIGVETFYGRITGSYRVLDALATLAFHYPNTGNDRSEFFASELMNFFALGIEENIPVDAVTGSYAGAMGLGQFMPSSYLEYAVDMDGDGRRDLWKSLDDIIGSVANYLHRHGWKMGEPIVYPLTATEGAKLELVADRDFKPQKSMLEVSEGGFASALPVDGDALVSIVRLQEEDASSYWLGFNNFYVITRYNRSPLYAMAVFDLSEAIRRGMGE